MGDLQRLTDRVGERLARSVAIDDPRMRLQSYSPHYGAVDEQRLASILHRQANPEAIDWAHEHKVQHATGWRRVPANPGRGMLGRVCVPIRFRGLHLGYLWIIDADESLTAEELQFAEQAAEEAADIMYRDGLLSDLQRARGRELLRDLLDEDPAIRTQAVSGLAEDALLEIDCPVRVLVLDTTTPTGDGDRASLADLALTTTRRLVSQRRSLHLVRPDHAILVVTCGRGVRPAELAARIGAEYGGRFRVGLGDEVPTAAEAHLSYRQALRAVLVGQVLGREGTVTWSDLGIYRLLVELNVDQAGLDLLHPALTRLAEHQLLETLETYLDLAGDVKATAERLQVHRTTLYHRLGRIEEIGEVSLRSGTDRLTLHLGLKLGHLSGRFRTL